jgi:hypothetical protein
MYNMKTTITVSQRTNNLVQQLAADNQDAFYTIPE